MSILIELGDELFITRDNRQFVLKRRCFTKSGLVRFNVIGYYVNLNHLIADLLYLGVNDKYITLLSELKEEIEKTEKTVLEALECVMKGACFH